MSDHDAAPDPVDKAYVQAEALLDDEAARAARRARLLAAVAEPEAAPTPTAPRARTVLRRGGWLAAASVAVFCAFLAGRIYQPVRDQAPLAMKAPALAESSSPQVADDLAAPAPPPVVEKPSMRAPRSSVTAAQPAPPHALAEAAPEAFVAPSPPPAPPPPPQFALAAPAPAPAAASTGRLAEEVTVTGSRIARRDLAKIDPAVRLRAAAAGGRTEDMEALLAQGVAVDAADADGTTALMKSIQADHPAAAALLRRHGASLDRKDHEGVTARDMARTMADPELDQALGLTDRPLGSQ